MPKSAKNIISAKEIVSEVKRNFKEKNPLYEKYLQDHAIFYLDPVENNEFLREGWSESIIYKNIIVREVGREFSFLIDVSTAKELVLEACIAVEDPYLHPVTLTLFIEKEPIGEATIRFSHFQNTTFILPSSLKDKKVTITGKVQYSKPGTKLFIKSIGGFNKDVSLKQIEQSLLMEINHSKVVFERLMSILDWHKQPERLMPANTKLKFFKKAVLKIIRPFTTPQVAFNSYIVDALTLLHSRLDKMEEITHLLLQMRKKD